ncbi:hypothetical protein C8R42DRAFT_724671 [Lentinula raphanica]|nr:hypothetical protein C8R42DRAFT_724671 [Lentinula raphanica]
MPAHRFAILTKLQNPNATTRVIFPSLLFDYSPMDPKTSDLNRTLAHANNLVAIDRTPVAQHVLKEQGRMDKADNSDRHDFTNLHQQEINAPDKPDLQHRLENVVGLNLPVARKTGRALNHANILDTVDHAQVAQFGSKQKRPLVEYSAIEGPVRRDSTNFQRPVSVGPSKSEPSPPPQVQTHQMPGHTVPVKAELESSISRAVRNRRQVIRRSPYPTRSRQRYRTSESQSSMPATVSSEDRSPTNDCSEDQFPTNDSFENQTSSSSTSSTRDACSPQNTLLAQSSFGFTALDYHQRKVKFKDVHTSWYIYSTPTSIDSPPELPRNAMALEHNVLFMHINETQRTKYAGQLSNLIKYCVSLWIWNGDSLKWERISVGERRVVNGYKLCLSLGYLTDIYPQWVTPKSFTRLIRNA